MTEKSMRRKLKRIWFHIDQLHNAMIDAHNKDLINYPDDKYREEGPCYTLNELRERVRKTTQKKIAEVITYVERFK